MSDSSSSEISGQHWAMTTREEVQHLERSVHQLAANAVAVEGRVNRLERDLRDVQDHYRERDRLWALGLLVTLAITVVAGVVTLNGQIARLEERVEALREQVQASNRPALPPRWQP